MAALYPGTPITGYNINPPPDDGTVVPGNLITWAGIKTKIGDPLNVFGGSVDSNLTAAFGKTLDGASVVATAVSLALTAANQGQLIKATAAGITITTPNGAAVGAPFAFAVNNQSTGTITIAGNATGAQTVDGAVSQVIQAGGGCVVKFDGINWVTFGLQSAQVTTGGNSHGFNAPINLGLTASVATNILTIAVKNKAGNDPSAGDPVLIPFRDAVVANGDPVWVSVTAPLNMNTNAIGATLGTANTVPFRFWVLAFNNSGTAALALWHSGAGSSPPAINALNPSNVASTVGISAAATSAGVFYTANGTSIANQPFVILGFLDYASGLATAGTYSSAPTIVELFGPGINKPGNTVQMKYLTSTAGQTVNTSTLTITGLTTTIAPSSAVNLIMAEAYAIGKPAAVNNGGADLLQQIARSGAATSPSNLVGNVSDVGISESTAGSASGTLVNKGIDQPGTTSATPYSVYIYSNGGSAAWLGNQAGASNQTASMILTEIMA